jgi:hypothetical protein
MILTRNFELDSIKEAEDLKIFEFYFEKSSVEGMIG